jgi:16S rRNA (adenine1518-N6/adenine1519-N6)-dimethyltransferase
MQVSPKKYLGQHFLVDENIASRIVDAFSPQVGQKALEIGPGTGVLTRTLLDRYGDDLFMIDIDQESTAFLKKKFPKYSHNILQGDFLSMNLAKLHNGSISIIGNFPYNISSQIFFKILENRDTVPLIVGMVQKEVGERIAAGPGSKTYGILSVLLSAFYDIEYLFTVEPEVFDPPPKVRSSVLRLIRNKTNHLRCNEIIFARIVKLGFQNRRKTLRNALKSLNLPEEIHKLDILGKRAEQLSVEDFTELTEKIELVWKN